INNGSTYSLVRVRTVDACGNATLADVSVLPLQNISVSASNTCFFTNIVLSVDTIPNAIYTWYRKNTPTDSVLLGTGLTYNLPFFMPEQIGDYICKMELNNGCVTRMSHFILDGNCGNQFLPANLTLQGKKAGNNNQLHWSNTEENGLLKYIVERKRANEANYSSIGTVAVHQGKKYLFNDITPGSGMNHYRLKLVYASKHEYSNVVSLKAASQSIAVYPNPAKERVNITIKGDKTAQYRVEIVSTAGEIIYSTEVKNVTSATIVYTKRNSLPPGMYLVRIKNIDANTTEIRKLLFE
ncbi:MAG: T9SS type A sorting domain-containing protein, partial [Flavisolibacter sp.]